MDRIITHNVTGQSVVREFVGYALTKYGNITFKQLKLIGSLNSFSWRVTDCKWTYDHMCDNRRKIIKQIKQCNYLDIYEVALRLDDQGIEHLVHEFLGDIDRQLGGLYWEWGKLIDSIKDIYAIKLNKERRPIKQYI